MPAPACGTPLMCAVLAANRAVSVRASGTGPIVPNISFGSCFERMGYDCAGGEEECAEQLGITVGHVRRLCRGKRMPSHDLVEDCRRLEEALVAEREA